jgi:CheY-like chemotaxis protein
MDKLRKVKQKLTRVIIYSDKDHDELKTRDNLELDADFTVVTDDHPPGHLLEEVIAHVHIPHQKLSAEKRALIEKIRNREDILVGKNVLVVDDDVRNLFALTSVLEKYEMNVITAESGKEAIHVLNTNPRVEMVLMDIMMPEMDGYETTRRIRLEHNNKNLPIVAVTAKALKDDRQKCIKAGASDYIIKPIKIDQLLSLMRLWFTK